MARVVSAVSVMGDPVMFLSILFFILVASLQWLSQQWSVRPTANGMTLIDSWLLKAFTEAADVVESGVRSAEGSWVREKTVFNHFSTTGLLRYDH